MIRPRRCASRLMRVLSCVLVLAAGTADAQLAPETSTHDDAGARPVTATVGVDAVFGTGYVFRGIVQELDPDITLQPFVEIALRVNDRWRIRAGSWHSVHSGSLRRNIGAWYAADVYAASDFRVSWMRPGAWVRFYASPGGGYRHVGTDGAPGITEVGLSLAIDDSRWLRLSPSLAAAFEVSEAQADFGQRKGIYGEAAIQPAVRLPRSISMTFPARVGISLRNYYEAFDQTSIRDHRFGYLQAGAVASIPIRLARGAWEARAGFSVYFFGPHRKVQQVGDEMATAVKTSATLGLASRW